MPAPSAALAARHARLRQAMAALSLDALVISHRPNILYLSNFSGTSGLAVVDARRLYLITDFRYSAAVDRLLTSPNAPPTTAAVRVETSYDEALTKVLGGLGAQRIGFEAAHVPVSQHATWTRLLPGAAGSAQFVASERVVEQQRVVKDAFEIDLLREAAARLSDVACGVLRDLAAPGRTERDLAAEIDWRMKRAGFDRPAFDTIVATGANSALPHAHPGAACVRAGDLLLFDFGGELDGYCVDLTRTVVLGRATDEQRRIYRAVHAAQRAAIDAIRPGGATDAVDAAARDLLTEEGYGGDAFGHSTGHGLGLEVHEEPRLGKRLTGGPSPPPLQAGMVCTVEPGVYLPHVGGVRLEDDVVVTGDGCEVITDVPFDEALL